MKKSSKKGFTIVELVIVIAVIAILAGVLIPTFSGIVAKAKDSALLQEATSIYHEVLGISPEGTLDLNATDGEVDAYIVLKNTKNENVYFTVIDGALALDKTVTAKPANYLNVAEVEGFAATAGEFEVYVYTAPAATGN